MIKLDLYAIARALGGEVHGANVRAPGPGHSPSDRSLSIKLSPSARHGFITHSFAGDHWADCHNHVCRKLGLDPRNPGRRLASPAEQARSREPEQKQFALGIWGESVEPRGTPAETYLAGRKLTLDAEIAGEVIRYHPSTRLRGRPVGGIVALFRDIATNEPRAIQRTFLDQNAGKICRWSLAPTGGAAIKINADEAVTSRLCIGEGVETCIAARLAGFNPVWAIGSVGGIASFPVLPGIEHLTILGETDDHGANARAAAKCAARYNAAGREVHLVTPRIRGDLADVWREIAK